MFPFVVYLFILEKIKQPKRRRGWSQKKTSGINNGLSPSFCRYCFVARTYSKLTL